MVRAEGGRPPAELPEPLVDVDWVLPLPRQEELPAAPLPDVAPAPVGAAPVPPLPAPLLPVLALPAPVPVPVG